MTKEHTETQNIFISYSSPDKKIATALCNHLEENGLSCWIAPRDIIVGKDYAEAIIEAIAGSRIMVLVFSEAAGRSKHVRNEVERAFNHQLVIMPFRIQDIMPSHSFEYFLSSTQWLDAIQGKPENYFDELYKNCCAALKGEPQQQRKNTPAPRTQNKTAYIIIAVMIIALAGLVFYFNRDNKTVNTAIVPITDSQTQKLVDTIHDKKIVPEPDKKIKTIVSNKLEHLAGATYSSSTNTDKITFFNPQINRVRFSGKLGQYMVSGQFNTSGQFSGRTNTGGAISGYMNFSGDKSVITGSIHIKESGMDHVIEMKKVTE